MIGSFLLVPFRGLRALTRGIGRELLSGRTDAADRALAELRDLYWAVEAGSITVTEFERREAVLLDRLAALRAGEASVDREP